MKRIRDLDLASINKVVEAATLAASEEARIENLPVVGYDESGNLMVHPGRKLDYL